jgi:hypothetical protein
MSKGSKATLAERYVEQRYAHITDDVERMRNWIWEALWSFADDMEEDRLEEEVQMWEEE